MPNDPFPASINVARYCDRNESVNCPIALGNLQRLSQYLNDTQDRVQVHLAFGKDEGGNRFLTGELSARVGMICQRCLEDIEIPLESRFRLRLATSEKEARSLETQAESATGNQEILVCEDGQLDALTLVEDELILSLPIVVNHDDDTCSEALNRLKKQENRLAETRDAATMASLEKLKDSLKRDK